MRWLPLLFTLTLLPTHAAAQLCTGKTGEAGAFTRNIDSGGLTRAYMIDVPEGYDPTQGAPLIFNFHWWGGNAPEFRDYTGMHTEGNSRGAIVVHPQGHYFSWNAGTCCGLAVVQQVDDVQFVKDMLAEISDAYCVDPSRIYASGFSNGAYMSHRLACEMADTFAAIAAASGLIAVSECAPSRPVPVHHSQGTDDLLVWPVRGRADSQRWASMNGCGLRSEVYYEQQAATCQAWSRCDEGADVEFCLLDGVPHDWIREPWYDTTLQALDFFYDHPMP